MAPGDVSDSIRAAPPVTPQQDHKHQQQSQAPAASASNDWPYGLDPGIVHNCVWLKTPLDLKPEDGDLTDQARGLVEEFVKTTFREPLGEEKNGERVLWFKNWAKLQSVRALIMCMCW
ncbi:hypothetical protein GTA08_BOTSDO14182 [Botryosphaeria dothidea]|uniref:Uncharacterized protein n=1 Tax=Botryosphaeria dothidea TaxID=55169 RepID=A0A8H4IR01_9PEZI|nr:hypothetical protein GTA08_BOTSDO14182 [Botryosphaeria dothidea]